MCFGKLQYKNKRLSVGLSEFPLLFKFDKKFLGIKIKPFSSFFRWKTKQNKTKNPTQTLDFMSGISLLGEKKRLTMYISLVGTTAMTKMPT